ncbi:type II toxin-antitoxin system tRNA(fMet)-specific endonuclease VapC [Salinispira pacifica]|uniref:type II toxin-antitoxin system tRNA(fMet)-specific endonuclease VapC n=1 Tax=Salinispira pacifica TaxID=1307761 RepID=UPI00059D1C4F
MKNKFPAMLDRIESIGIENIGISTITLAELEFGIANSDPEKLEQNRNALMEFLIPFDIIEFSSTDAFEYGQIRTHLKNQGILIGNMDMLIGAQARARDLILVTNNEKEFQRIESLEIENWTITN